MAHAALCVRNLTKRFGAGAATGHRGRQCLVRRRRRRVLHDARPSGCGKTTTLRMIAGLEQASSGEITVDGRDFMAVPPQKRNIGMVFQSYALFPHLTIFENVAYGPQAARPQCDRNRAPRRRDAGAAAARGLTRRVTLPRCRVANSSAFRSHARSSTSRRCSCSTSRFANLDAKLRVMMRDEIRALQRRLGITTLYVTHDQEEATAVSDRLAVFNHGRLIQIGTPEEVYARPNTLFVADFIGRATFFRFAFAIRLHPPPARRLPMAPSLVPARQVRLEAAEAATIPSADRESRWCAWSI
mgnify:CR=1 FL=1